jgi:serine/threonine-protein kinase RsbT
MINLSNEVLEIHKEQDVVLFRNRLRELSVRIGMNLVNQTKLITAASELIRNMLKYAGGGTVTIQIISVDRKTGIRIVFEDKGPGIENIGLAMQDGYSTSRSLGLGLPGAKRLVNEFNLKSIVGEGTTITVIKWKNG